MTVDITFSGLTTPTTAANNPDRVSLGSRATSEEARLSGPLQ
jgi:hypothetical protein